MHNTEMTTPKEKILIVEDEGAIRDMLGYALMKAGFLCEEAADTEAARSTLKAERPDLILLDWMLPGGSGIELARRAAEIDPEMKIMFITGFAAVALNAANQAPEDAKVLSKPFHLKDLVQEVDRVIAA